MNLFNPHNTSVGYVLLLLFLFDTKKSEARKLPTLTVNNWKS